MANALQQLHEYGQSIWFDNISRPLIRSGDLAAMVRAGLRGVTSNPTIFEKAVAGSDAYDSQLRDLLGSAPAASTGDLVRALMVEDIRMAADTLAPVYENEAGRD